MSRKTTGSLKLNKDSDVTSTSTFTAPHLDLTQDLNFGLSTAPKASPLPTSAPDWFLPIQAQLNRQEQLINRQGLRLSQLEDVVIENQRLRTDLALARQEINELKSRLGSPIPQEQPTPMAEDFPELGTAHSKYATPVKPATRTTPRGPLVPTVSTPSQPSFLAAATRGQATTDTVVPPKVHRRRNPLTSRQRQALARSFMPVSDNQGYQYLYLPTRFRERISSLRRKLRQLKLDNGRILDAHYPDNNIVALLIHNDYAVEATAILAKSGLKPITDFDPRAESCLRDPAFASLTKEQRKEKMVDVHQKRSLKALEHIREVNRPSVARAFLKLSWITPEQFKEVTSNRGLTAALTTTADPNLDSVMSEVVKHFTTDTPTASPSPSPAVLSSPSGAGEPVEEL